MRVTIYILPLNGHVNLSRLLNILCLTTVLKWAYDSIHFKINVMIKLIHAKQLK